MLPINENALRKSIIEDTPEYTKQLLMELNPTYWRQFFGTNLKVVRDEQIP